VIFKNNAKLSRLSDGWSLLCGLIILEIKMKAYCPLIKNNLCRYGGNKRYNYGIVASGTASYCRLAKKWVHDLKTCPKGRK